MIGILDMLYVCDTNSIIDFFADTFIKIAINSDEIHSRLSYAARELMNQAFSPYDSDIKISIPCVVLLEIYEKWLIDEEKTKIFYYEVFSRLNESPNVEIRPIDEEVMENLITIHGNLDRHDLHDKLIVASAIVLKTTLISSDGEISSFVSTNPRLIPGIIH